MLKVLLYIILILFVLSKVIINISHLTGRKGPNKLDMILTFTYAVLDLALFIAVVVLAFYGISLIPGSEAIYMRC